MDPTEAEQVTHIVATWRIVWPIVSVLAVGFFTVGWASFRMGRMVNELLSELKSDVRLFSVEMTHAVQRQEEMAVGIRQAKSQNREDHDHITNKLNECGQKIVAIETKIDSVC